MKEKDVVECIDSELEKYTGVDWAYGNGGKHAYVEVSYGGAIRRIPYSKTPRGPNLLNVRADIRRVLRNLGAPRLVLEAPRKKENGSLGKKLAGTTFTQVIVDDPIVEQQPERETPVLAIPEEKTTKNGRMTLSQIEIVTATRLLIANGKQVEQEGAYEFNDGWDDQRVRDIVIALNPERKHITAEKFADFRRENFGRLSSESPPQSEQTSLNRSQGMKISHLERRLDDVLTRLTAVENYITSVR